MSDSISTLKSCNFDKLNLSLTKYTKARNRYKKCYTKWRDNRRANIVNIRLLIIGLEQTKHKTNIAGLTSGVGGVVGGVLTGVGLITMPFSRKYFLWFSHTCDLLNYCDCVDDCVNHFLHCNRNSWTNCKSECAHLEQYNLLFNN